MSPSYIATAFISYFLGVVTGYVGSCLLSRVAVFESATKNSKTIVTFVVVFVWFLSMVIEVFNPDYNTNPLVHTLMGSIVGFFYRFEQKKR